MGLAGGPLRAGWNQGEMEAGQGVGRRGWPEAALGNRAPTLRGLGRGASLGWTCACLGSRNQLAGCQTCYFLASSWEACTLSLAVELLPVH